MRKTVLLAGGITVAAASLVALACTANASDSGDGGMIKQPTMSYTSPSNQSTPVHANLSRGTPVDVVCVAEGQLVNGNSYWARINSDGQTGFVYRDAVHISARHTVLSLILGLAPGEWRGSRKRAAASRIRRRDRRPPDPIQPCGRRLDKLGVLDVNQRSSRACPTIRGGRLSCSCR